MSSKDLEKFNQCLSILQTSELQSPLIWLWVWDSVKFRLNDAEFVVKSSELEVWNDLVRSIDSGFDLNLESGSDRLEEDLLDWLFERGHLFDPSNE